MNHKDINPAPKTDESHPCGVGYKPFVDGAFNRTCKKCGETKPIEEFCKNKNCKNGATSKCRKCANIEQTNFRLNNRKYVNDQARSYADKKYPHRIEERKLISKGFKKCSKCGNVFEVKEFNKGRSVCYKCRTGHNRGFFTYRDDGARWLNVLTDQERKIRQRENTKKWRGENPEKVKLIDKKSKRRPEYKEKERIWKFKRYHAGLDKESRLRYSNSNKGKASSRKAKIKYANNNPDKMKIKDKRQRDNLNDCYVISKIKRQVNISTQILRKYPELIEAKRIQIKLKRLVNEKCN